MNQLNPLGRLLNSPAILPSVLLAFLLLLSVADVAVGEAAADSNNNAEYKYLGTENGIRMFESYDEESGFYWVKVVMQTPCSISALTNLTTDTANFPKWLEPMRKVNFIKGSRAHYFLHIEYHSPWPLSDRDSVTETRVSRNTDNGSVEIRFNNVPDLIPEKQNLVRSKVVHGIWRFTPAPGDETVVSYELLVNPGGSVPNWLVNLERIKVPFKTLENMRDQLPSYKNLDLKWLQ